MHAKVCCHILPFCGVGSCFLKDYENLCIILLEGVNMNTIFSNIHVGIRLPLRHKHVHVPWADSQAVWWHARGAISASPAL